MEGKIKVLHRTATTGRGGVDRFVLNYYSHVDREKIQFDFMTRDRAFADAEDVKRMGMRVRTFTATEHDNKPLLAEQINGILSDNYDILHMNTSVLSGLFIEERAMELGMKAVILHSHSTGVDFADSAKNERYRRLHEHHKAMLSPRYATHFFACSKAAADWMFGPQIPREQIHIIKNAIELEKFSYNCAVRERIRAAFGLQGKYVIGHVGRYTYQKNHEFLINVFARVHKRNGNAVLVLAGEGELAGNVGRQISEMGLESAVFQLGFCGNVHELLQGFDMFLLPSRFEGLSMVAIEAQASGLPCVLSRNMTGETCVAPNAWRLPLDEDIWEQEIMRLMDTFTRENMDSYIIDSGYDICHAAKKLEDMYRAMV